MNALELFERLAPLVGPAIEHDWHQRSLCILATRIVIDVAEYYGIEAEALPVVAMVYNAAYAKHVDNGEAIDVAKLHAIDGSWAVGIGFGASRRVFNKWAGHLIVAADGAFGDFTIRQAEREARNIITGPAIVGTLPAALHWCYEREGTRVEYQRLSNVEYLRAPDWRDRARRKKLVGALIRQVRDKES